MSERLPVAKTYKLYVGGAFVRSESGRHVAIDDHAGNHVANAPRGTRKDVRDAVRAARGALRRLAGPHRLQPRPDPLPVRRGAGVARRRADR